MRVRTIKALSKRWE